VLKQGYAVEGREVMSHGKKVTDDAVERLVSHSVVKIPAHFISRETTNRDRGAREEATP